MSKSMLICLGFLLLGFGSGIGLGLYIGGGAPASEVSDKSTGRFSSGFFPNPEAQTREETNAIFVARIRDLEKELAEQKKDQDKAMILADRLAFCKKFSGLFGLSPFDDDLKINAVMAAYLEITPQEQKALEQHLAQILNETKKIEQAKTILVKQTDKNVSYEIPTYSEGKAIKAELNNFVMGDIGEERGDVFMANGKWQFNSVFSGFGEGKTDVEFTRTDKGGSPSYTMKERFQDGSGDERPIGSSVPSCYQDVLELNPAQ